MRLIGVSLSNLQDSPDDEKTQISLFDVLEPQRDDIKKKTRALEDTIFDLHTKYGRNILKTGKELEIYKKIYNSEEDK